MWAWKGRVHRTVLSKAGLELAMTSQTHAPSAASLEIRFDSMFLPGRALSFPCDEHGCVDLHALPRPARRNYLFAKAMVGREFMYPAIVSAGDGGGRASALRG